MKSDRSSTFIVLFAFLTTFVVARITTYLIRFQLLPDFYLSMGQTHIHHLNYGIFILSITGYLSLIYHTKRWNDKLAFFYGIGLGLTFDEFSLWLSLEDNYYARGSYEAIIVISAIFLNIIYFGGIWKRIFWFFRRRIKSASSKVRSL